MPSDEICICGAPSKDGVCSVPGCVASSNATRQECTDCGTLNTPDAALCVGCHSTNLRPLSAAGLFVAVHKAVMRGADCVAVATSKTFAKRIAAALNNHKPNREGV